jgi:transcription initiation factor TFIID subunit 11
MDDLFFNNLQDEDLNSFNETQNDVSFEFKRENVDENDDAEPDYHDERAENPAGKLADQNSFDESDKLAEADFPTISATDTMPKSSADARHQSIDDTQQQMDSRKKKIEQQEEDSKKMQVLMANFSEEQLNRYEIFRRSTFPKSNIKKIIQTVCGKSVAANVISLTQFNAK